ncbi:hypothetical protein [Pseudophaeobacter sp. EL27]|uniref:hypothetical protein n=1 Tax=Pseudophaeobacter sp. EL27 TaxID=2107580 RepID=UPI0013C51D88|nr:hypothetical protein [Pseudophaeobacter sp. EL27]
MAQSGAHGGKILSCCYCGVQSSFVPGPARGGGSVSTLICGTCGAPLSSQKARPLTPGKGARLSGAESSKPGAAKSAGKKVKGAKGKAGADKRGKGKKVKKRKGLLHKFLSEAVDIVEDIFD